MATTDIIETAHHRNGVAGWPFEVALTSTHLIVTFQPPFLREWQDEAGQWHEEYGTPDPLRVPLPVIFGNYDGQAARDGRIGITFHGVEDGGDLLLVAITDCDADPEDYRTAVFASDLLHDGVVTSGINSWRGDRYHGAALRALGLP